MSTHFRSPQSFIPGFLLSLLVVGCPLVASQSAQKAKDELFSLSQMTEVKLKGVTVHLGKPIQVTAQLPYEAGKRKTRSGEVQYWAFNHTTPTMAKFPTGELLVTYSLVADANNNPLNLSGHHISRDGGKTWSSRYTVLPEHQPMIYFPLKSGALQAIPAYLYQNDVDDFRNFHAYYYRFEQGGRRLTIEPEGVRVINWPWSVPVNPGSVPRRDWIVRTSFDGNVVKIGNQLLATAQSKELVDSSSKVPEGFQWLTTEGQKVFQRNVLLSSEDNGRTWRYFSTIADASLLPPTVEEAKGAEGPTETAMIQLADGDLMAVFRVGSGRAWNLRRSYSKDGGRTWTKAESIPPYSVEPSMLRMKNEVIALSTGRPGIRLWLSTDPRGTTWQDVDIVEHHNRWAPDNTYRIGSYQGGVLQASGKGEEQWQTSSYTELVEVAPNRLLLVYDRGPKPPVDANDLTRIFVLPIRVER